MRQNQKKACHGCPLAKTAALVGDLWTLLIIRDLLGGHKRYRELLESLEGISTRTLSKRLKELEDEDLITRKTFGEYPPRVEYSITTKGKKLGLVTGAMKKYGEKYLYAS